MSLDFNDSLDRASELEEQQRAQALAKHRRAMELQAALGEAIECEDCGIVIPLKRRELVPGCCTCVDCQAIREGRK